MHRQSPAETVSCRTCSDMPAPLGSTCHVHAAFSTKSLRKLHVIHPFLILPNLAALWKRYVILKVYLSHLKQVKTLILKGCRNSTATCPLFLLSAHNLYARGLTPAGRSLEVLTAVTCPPRRPSTPRIHSHDSKNLHRASAKAVLAPLLP